MKQVLSQWYEYPDWKIWICVPTYNVTFTEKCLLLNVVYAFCPVDDPGSLFEKRDFKDRQRTTGTKSTLSMRLEQCPQQLNNPFNEYSKFDGKVNYSTFSIFPIVFSFSSCQFYLFIFSKYFVGVFS